MAPMSLGRRWTSPRSTRRTIGGTPSHASEESSGGRQQGEIEGSNAEPIAVGEKRVADRDREGRVPLVHAGLADHEHLALLDRRDVRQRGDAPAFGKTEVTMGFHEIRNQVGAVEGTPCRDITAEALEAGVVRAGAEESLRVAVDDRAARAPQAVPQEQVVPCGWIAGCGPLGPLAARGKQVRHEGMVERKRVVAVEDQHAMVGIRRRGVGPGQHVRAAYATERVRRRPGLRMAERVALGGSDLGVEVRGGGSPIHRSVRAQGREEGRLAGARGWRP